MPGKSKYRPWATFPGFCRPYRINNRTNPKDNLSNLPELPLKIIQDNGPGLSCFCTD